jgi:hypothetical protein
VRRLSVLSGRVVAGRRRRVALLGVLSAISTVLAVSAPPALASSDTLYVTPNGTSPFLCTASFPCTLGSAISGVNAGDYNGDAVTITVAAGTYTGTPYTVTSGTPTSLTINGAGAGVTFVDGQGSSRAIETDVGYPVTLQNLTLENGHTSGYGADLYNDGTGTTTLSDAVATHGISTNAYGGLVDATSGTLNIESSTVENAGDSGTSTGTDGADDFSGATMLVEDSSFLNEYGQVIVVDGGSATLTVEQSTLYGSATPGLDGTGVTDLDSASGGVFVLNTAIDGGQNALYAASGQTIEIGADILEAGPSGETDCYTASSHGTYTDGGADIGDDTSCDLTNTDSKVSTDAAIGLAAPAFNGGPTETQRITSSSSAANTTSVGGLINLVCGPDDQRGVPKSQPGASHCDSGPYEIAPPIISSLSGSSAEPGSPITVAGTNLSIVSSVSVGGTPATITAQSASALTFTVPALPTGSQPITLTDADGSAATAFSVAGPLITGSTLPDGEPKLGYSQQIPATGGAAPLSWSVVGGSLPSGLTLSSSGLVSGTPTTTGQFAFTAKLVDADGASSTQALTLDVVKPAASFSSKVLKIVKGKPQVVVTCEPAGITCDGTVELTKTIKVEVTTKHGQHRTKNKVEVLASVTIDAPGGSTQTVSLRFTSLGRRDLGRSSKQHPGHAQLTLKLVNVAGPSEKVKIT